MNDLAVPVKEEGREVQKISIPTVRFGTSDDIPEIVSLFKEWCAERKVECSDQILTEETMRIMSTGRLFILVSDGVTVGFMGGYIQDLFWNNERVAKEQCIYVTPSQRGFGGDILVLAFERWAKFMKCSKAIISPTKSCTTKFEAAGHRLSKLGYEIHGLMMSKDL